MVGSIIVAEITSTAVAAFSAAQTAAAFAINFAVSQIVTRVFGQNQQGQQDNGVRQQVPPSNVNAIPVVYGDAYLGGTFVDAVLSTDQKTMYYVMAVSCISPNGQFSFDTTKFYYGDRLITFDTTDLTKVVSLSDEATPPNVDTKISGNLYISLYKSSATGTITSLNGAAAPSTVMGGSDIASAQRWPSTGRQMNGLAFAIIKLNYSQDAGTTSLSPITFHASHYLNGTGVAKPGDVWYDYVTNPYYGGAVDAAFVDSASATALNTYSDGLITYTPSGGGSATEARYRINGVLDAGQSVLNNIDKIMTCCDSWMSYNAAAGQWSAVINKSETAVYSFDDDNIIGEIRVSATDITQSINQVEAKFPNSANRDQPDYVNLETPSILLYPNEPVNKYSVSYDLVNDSVRAQYLANRILEQSREDLIVSFSTTYYGIQVDAGAVVSVTNSDYGWTNKLFRVVKVNEASLPDGSLGARLEMNEYSAAVYDDFDITQYTPVPNSNIPSAIYFSALTAPTVVANNYNVTPPTFTVRVTVPTTGRVTYGTLYYTTSSSPLDFDWKVLATANAPAGTAAVNGSTYDFANLTLAGGTYYFAYVVGNELGQSTRSSSSTAFVWSPVNSESGNVAFLQGEIDGLTIDVADKVSKTSTSVLTGTIVPTTSGGIKTGTITWNSSGVLTGGSGVAITSNGIVGAQSGVAKFTIDTAGNALFMGDINTDGDAYFEGRNPASFSVLIGSTSYSIDYSSLSNGISAASGKVRGGVVGYSASLTSSYNVGVLGVGRNGVACPGIGVVGEGDSIGGYFSTTSSTGSALECNNTGGGFALRIDSGTFSWGGYTVASPTGSTTTFLRNDGTWAIPSGSGGGTVTSVSGTGNVYGLTLSGTVTTSGSLTLGGSFNTASIPLSAVNLSGSNITARLIGTSGNTSGVTDVTFSGTLTGGASGTISWTMGTNTAAININVTSDSRLKKDIVDLSYGLDFVKKLRPVQFKWNHELFAHYGDKQAYGFLANEVEEIVGTDTTMVTTIEQGPLEGYKSFSNDGIVAALVKSIQQLEERIAALENKV